MPLYLAPLTFEDIELLSFDQLADMEFSEPDSIVDADLSSLLQFNIRAFTRSLPTALDTNNDLAQLLGLWRGAGEAVEVGRHLCGNVALLPTYNATVNTQPKYDALVSLIPTYTGIVKAREC